MPDKKTLRTIEELRRVVRALGFEFEADTVFVVGSQAILASMPDAPEVVRQSPEFDAFPGNARMWEIAQKELAPGVRPIASEHIHGMFGPNTPFHQTHGFYIDGVDETTAKLPNGWRQRAIEVRSLEGRNADSKSLANGVSGAPCPLNIVSRGRPTLRICRRAARDLADLVSQVVHDLVAVTPDAAFHHLQPYEHTFYAVSLRLFQRRAPDEVALFHLRVAA